ncbi:MAG TPA: T9SS type A sorting domain-containing protein [Bacteroidia bacterium]
MIKKLLFIALLICTKQVEAQTVITSTGTPIYQPMLADSVTEFYVIANCPGQRLSNPQQTLSSCFYIASCGNAAWYAKGDSIYNGKVYKKVTNSSSYPPFQGLLREDATLRRVYFIPYCNTTEDLLYDFSLTQGATINYNLPNSSSSLMPSGVYTVDSIRLKHDYKNYYRKHFYLRNHAAAGNLTLEMIEGVGSVIHPLFLYYSFMQSFGLWGTNCIATNFNEFLSCKWNNGKKVYFDSCAYTASYNSACFYPMDSCNYNNNCGGIEQFASNEQVTVYPNPASSSLQVTFSGNIQNTTLQITDMLGNTLKQSTIKTEKTSIDVSDLAEGVYQFTIHSSEFIIAKRVVIVR